MVRCVDVLLVTDGEHEIDVVDFGHVVYVRDGRIIVLQSRDVLIVDHVTLSVVGLNHTTQTSVTCDVKRGVRRKD